MRPPTLTLKEVALIKEDNMVKHHFFKATDPMSQDNDTTYPRIMQHQ